MEDISNMETSVCNTQSKLLQVQWVPNMADLFPSCPRICNVPGFPSTALTITYKTDEMDWSSYASTLWSMEKRKSKEKWAFIVNKPVQYTEISNMMVVIVPACPETALISGFQSAPCSKVKWMSGTMEKFSTCPTVPTAYVVASLTLTKTAAQVNGFTTKSKLHNKVVPSMSRLLPTCPMISRIPGYPCEEFNNLEWVSDQTLNLSKPFTAKTVNLTETGMDAEDINKNMALLPTCPLAACIPGFPSSQQCKAQEPTMKNIRLSCPMRSHIPGCQSLQISRSSNWPTNQIILMSRQTKNFTVIINKAKVNGTVLKSNAALLPTCPSKTCIPGFPYVTEPKMQNILPSCPKRCKTVGFPSKEGTVHLDWSFNSLNTVEMFCSAPKQKLFFMKDKTEESKSLMKSMFALAPTCPALTLIPGFPFAPKPKVSPNMANLQPCIPKTSRIIGFQSRERPNTHVWLFEKKPLWGKLLKTRLDIHNQCHFDSLCKQFDHYSMSKMIALVPTCPREAQTPGFSSIPYMKVNKFYLRKESDMTSIFNSCPGFSLVPGVPSLNSVVVVESSWDAQEKPMWVKPVKQKSVLMSSTSRHYDQCVKTVLLAPTCPDKARNPGFPSVLNIIYAMTAFLPSCSYASSIPGMPSRKDTTQDPSQIDKVLPALSLFKEKPLKTKTLLVSRDFSTVKDKTLMFTLVYCCPSKARIPGFPSVPTTPMTQTSMPVTNPSQPQTQAGPKKPMCDMPYKIDKLDVIKDVKRSGKTYFQSVFYFVNLITAD